MSNSLIVIVVATAAILLSATCHCIDVGIQKAAELEIQHDIEMKKSKWAEEKAALDGLGIR